MGWLGKLHLGKNCSCCFRSIQSNCFFYVPYSRLGEFLLKVVFKFGEQIVKWRSWRLPGQGGVVVISPQGFVSSAHFPFRKHINPFIRPAQRKSPRLPLRKAPPTPSLLSPTHTPTTSTQQEGRQNPTSPQTGKRTQPHPQNHKHPSEIRVIHKLRQ